MEAIMERTSLETLGSCTLVTGPGIKPGSQVTQLNCPWLPVKPEPPELYRDFAALTARTLYYCGNHMLA